MGINIFGRSASSFEGYRASSNIEPDPKKFIVEEAIDINGHCILTVIYPNCTTYEGKKILFFSDTESEDIIDQKVIDPHFSDKGLSPFARFEPTDEGLLAAIKLARVLE